MTDTEWFEEAVEDALSDPEEVVEKTESIVGVVEEYSVRLQDEYAEKYLDVMPEEIRRRRGFEQRLHGRWGGAFNLLEYFIILNHQSGAVLKEELIEKEEIPEDDPLFSALMRLHARACQVSREVLALMRAGYADGAFSRWRALYEMAISSQFITEHGEDAATRFLAHKIIDDYYEIELFQKHCDDLGFDPIPEEELEDLEERFEMVVDEYGGVFKTTYGWAAAELDEDPSRRAVAEAVGLDRYEPYFAFASNTVHGGSKGTLYRLGLSHGPQTEVMLAGPSNSGFTDPAQYSVLTLVEVTNALLSAIEGLEWRLISLSLMSMAHEVIAVFDDVRQELEAEVSQADDKGYTIDGW